MKTFREDDIRAAAAHHLLRLDDFIQQIERAALDREYAANALKLQAAIAEMSRSAGSSKTVVEQEAFFRLSDRIDRLFAEQDRLSSLRWPEQPTKGGGR